MKSKKSLDDINPIEVILKPKHSYVLKQSERTTFKLTTKAIEGLKWLQSVYNITIKEIFDSLYSEISFGGNIDLDDIGKKTKEHPKQFQDCTRKTYVISKLTLLYFNAWSKDYEISRDDLISSIIEHIVDRDKADLATKKEKYIQTREMLTKLNTYIMDKYEKINELLGDDDLTEDIRNYFVNAASSGIELILKKMDPIIKTNWKSQKKQFQ